MKESRPLLLLNKYRSILVAAITVELVTFLVSLTDSIIGGNTVGPEALMAIGLAAPFFSASSFIQAVINSGTVTNYSYQIGRFNQRRAYEFFSQGLILAIVSGVLFTLFFLVGKQVILGLLYTDNIKINTYLNDYYSFIIFYFMFAPVSCVLDNMVVADGGEKLSATANTIQILGNVVLSYALSLVFGVKGIAFATVFCKAFFVLLISTWFLSKHNTLRFVRHFTFLDAQIIIRRGIVRAMTFIMSAIMMGAMNIYILRNYDVTTFEVWVVVQKVLGLSGIFMGLAMTLQPLVATLRGEKNTKALRHLVGRSSMDMIIAGLLLTIPIMFFTRPTLRLFGITDPEVIAQGVVALRITGITILFMSLMVFFFVYYFLIEKMLLAFVVTLLKDLVCPVFLVFVLEQIWQSNPNTIWSGLHLAPTLAILITFLIILIRYGKDQVPFLIPVEEDRHIYIYFFHIDTQNVVNMSETAYDLLGELGFSKRTRLFTSQCIEDMLLLIKEKNESSKKPVMAEVTLIVKEKGVRLIIRDSGIIFKITDEDARVSSLRQYFVANLITLSEYKIYMKTTGFNRNEIYFED